MISVNDLESMDKKKFEFMQTMDPVLDVCVREPIMDPVLDVCVRKPKMPT